MLTKRIILTLAFLATCVTVWAAEKADRGKYVVEASTKSAFRVFAANPDPAKLPKNSEVATKPKLDFGKTRIEQPTERLLVKQAFGFKRSAKVPRPATPAAENPKVEPGKVRWHANFVSARTASRKSRKPVLLFQMMGNLDDRFC